MTNPGNMENRKVFWQNHIVAWKKSGGTQRAYCTQHKLSDWSFSTCKKRLLTEASSFIELPKQVPDISAVQPYEIVINDVVLACASKLCRRFTQIASGPDSSIMLNIPADVRVYMKLGATDMRKSFTTLGAIVQDSMKLNLFGKNIFIVYEDVFTNLLGLCVKQAEGKKRKFRFKNPLRSIDATVIDLCLKVFDWARFRSAKGAIKLHLMLDHQGCLPCLALVTDGKTHEVKPAKTLSFTPGTIVAMDKGYTDYSLFSAWIESEVFFVTRMKSNAVYKVIRRDRKSEGKTILRDEIIRLTGTGALEKCPHELRRIVAWDEEHKRKIILLTSIMHLAASTIAAVYKDRWQIELFFKALKQNLKVKTFVGTSENAVKTQILTALIAMLLLKFMQLKSTFGWSLSNLGAMVRMNLLTYRDLWAWLNTPFEVPVVEPEQERRFA